MATVREVAKLARVSPATVSKVLTNTPYVSEESRARVLEAIKTLGYTPKLAARALSSGKTSNIGVIFAYLYDHLFNDPYLLAILEGIEEICTAHQYNMLVSSPRVPVAESPQFQSFLHSGYFDGVITLEVIPSEPIAVHVEPLGCPYVAIGFNLATSMMNAIYPDDFTGAALAVDHLLELGHRDFALISVESSSATASNSRLSGYRAALEQVGIDFDAVPQVNGAYSIRSGAAAAQKLLDSGQRFTALISFNDRMAVGAIRHLQSVGMRVPEDVSVVGFDDIPSAELITPPLTTVRQPAHAMGVAAAEKLFQMLESGTSTPFSPRIFATELIVRGSTAPPKAL